MRKDKWSQQKKKRIERRQNEDNEGETAAAAPGSSAQGVECFFGGFLKKEKAKPARMSNCGHFSLAPQEWPAGLCTWLCACPDGCLCNSQECTQKCKCRPHLHNLLLCACCASLNSGWWHFKATCLRLFTSHFYVKFPRDARADPRRVARWRWSC